MMLAIEQNYAKLEIKYNNIIVHSITVHTFKYPMGTQYYSSSTCVVTLEHSHHTNII